MLRDLGHEVSARAVAAMYQDFLDVFILDETDSELALDIRALGLQVFSTDTVMNTIADKEDLAQCVLNACTVILDS
jgi:hypothetical protein